MIEYKGYPITLFSSGYRVIVKSGQQFWFDTVDEAKTFIDYWEKR